MIHYRSRIKRGGDCTDNQAPECLVGSKTPASSSITLTTLPSHDSIGESLESMSSGNWPKSLSSFAFPLSLHPLGHSYSFLKEVHAASQ